MGTEGGARPLAFLDARQSLLRVYYYYDKEPTTLYDKPTTAKVAHTTRQTMHTTRQTMQY